MLSRANRAVPGLLADTHAMLMRCGAALFAEQQGAAATRPDYRASLAAIAVPTLIVAGEEDRIVDPGRSREMAAAIPHADFRLAPACGHVPQREVPGFTASALRQWAEKSAGGEAI